MERPGYESDRSRVTVMDRSSGTKSVWAKDLDRSFGELAWGTDSWIYTTADNVGNHSLYAFDAKGNVHVLVEKGTAGSPRPFAGGSVVYLHDTLHSPVEIMVTARLPGQPAIRPVTKLNEAKVKAARMGAYEQFSFSGAKNEKVYGYVVKPVDFGALQGLVNELTKSESTRVTVH